MRRAILTLLCLVGMIFATSIRADTNTLNQGTAVQTYSGAGAESSNNLTFEAGKPQAALPMTPYPSALMGPGIFTGQPTASADQLYSMLSNMLAKIPGEKNVATGDMIDRMADGIDVTYKKAVISFAMSPSYAWYESHSSKTDVSDRVVTLPEFSSSLDIRGSWLGVISISTKPGEMANEQQVRNVLIKFMKDNMITLFPTQNIYFMYVPGGSTMNLGIKSEASSWGLFGALGSILPGATSAGFGGNYNSNNGTTQYATTYGHTVLVFVEDGSYHIAINTEAPVTQNVATHPQSGQPLSPAEATQAQPAPQTADVVDGDESTSGAANQGVTTMSVPTGERGVTTTFKVRINVQPVQNTPHIHHPVNVPRPIQHQSPTAQPRKAELPVIMMH